MKRFLTTVALVAIFLSAKAQGVTGAWYALLKIQGVQLHLVIHITQTGNAYSSTMDSPDQKAFGLAMDKTEFTDNKLLIEGTRYGLKYTGTFMPDSNMLKGNFSQGAANVPLNFYRTEVKEAVVAPKPRPQDPTSFPYHREEVVFTNPKGGDQLAGTLTTPTDSKAKSIVILITGSGPQNRDEELTPFNHRPFLVWSDWLTRHGIAVLRYDDRGIAKSTGNFGTATSADFADDAEAAVNYVRSRADLKDLKIGLMGHSEGGLIAPMVAARNKDVSFIVLLAGPGVPITQLMEKQVADQMKLAGNSDALIKKAVNTAGKFYAIMNANYNLPAYKLTVKVDSALDIEMRSYSSADLGGKSVDDIKKEYTALLKSAWWRYFIHTDPAEYLTKVKCPVLALDGTLDMQVNAESNLAGIKASLQKANNKHVEIISLPGLNHLFQKATTGSLEEYGQIEETVDPAALTDVSDWINKL